MMLTNLDRVTMTWKERVTRRAEALTSRSSPVSSILADVPNSEMEQAWQVHFGMQSADKVSAGSVGGRIL